MISPTETIAIITRAAESGKPIIAVCPNCRRTIETQEDYQRVLSNMQRLAAPRSRRVTTQQARQRPCIYCSATS